MSPSDPRLTLARPDLADRALEGRVAAKRFAPTRRLAVASPSTALFRAPTAGAERLDELLRGETFDALEGAGDFLWGQARRDGHIGFVRSADLAPVADPPTHWVSAIRTYAFVEPSIKSPASGPFSLNALVAIESEAGDFARTHDGLWFWRGHLAPIGAFERDPALVAERFLGAPYLWGGRTSLGVDCSGLIQQALYACGRACPRDAEQQASLGRGIAREELARGDLVCWNGHIGMMLDDMRLIHANGFHMAVAAEAVEGAITRNEAAGGPPTAFRRV
jgi:cell wall-associated NlpC family hydrolase